LVSYALSLGIKMPIQNTVPEIDEGRYEVWWLDVREALRAARKALGETKPPDIEKGGAISDASVLEYLQSLAQQESETIDAAVREWLTEGRWPRMRKLAKYLLGQRLVYAADASGFALHTREWFGKEGNPTSPDVPKALLYWLLTDHWDIYASGRWAREFLQEGCYTYDT